MTGPENFWITIKEAAELSGYSERHIRNWIRDRIIASEKFGGRRRIVRSSLLRVLRERSPENYFRIASAGTK